MTDSGQPYLIDLLSGSVSALAANVGTGIISVDNTHLYVAQGSDVKRIALADGEVSQILLQDAVAITSIALHEGNLWLGVRNATGFHVTAVDTATLIERTAYQITVPVAATAITAYQDRLIIGMGAQGIREYRLDTDVLRAETALNRPLIRTQFAQDGAITLLPAQTENIAAISYFINGRKVATAAETPFTTQLMPPSWLPNGQYFDLQARYGLLNGQVLTSTPQSLFMYSSDNVDNNFTVQLAVP